MGKLGKETKNLLLAITVICLISFLLAAGLSFLLAKGLLRSIDDEVFVSNFVLI